MGVLRKFDSTFFLFEVKMASRVAPQTRLLKKAGTQETEKAESVAKGHCGQIVMTRSKLLKNLIIEGKGNVWS